jgi:hypothetical protein
MCKATREHQYVNDVFGGQICYTSSLKLGANAMRRARSARARRQRGPRELPRTIGTNVLVNCLTNLAPNCATPT